MDRINQNQFAIFTGQKEHTDVAIKEIQDHIETHYSEKLSVETLAHQAAISSRNFVRRFKKATFNTLLNTYKEFVLKLQRRDLNHRL